MRENIRHYIFSALFVPREGFINDLLQAVTTSSKSGTSYKVSLDNGTDEEDPVSSTGGPKGTRVRSEVDLFPRAVWILCVSVPFSSLKTYFPPLSYSHGHSRAYSWCWICSCSNTKPAWFLGISPSQWGALIICILDGVPFREQLTSHWLWIRCSTPRYPLSCE